MCSLKNLVFQSFRNYMIEKVLFGQLIVRSLYCWSRIDWYWRWGKGFGGIISWLSESSNLEWKRNDSFWHASRNQVNKSLQFACYKGPWLLVSVPVALRKFFWTWMEVREWNGFINGVIHINLKNLFAAFISNDIFTFKTVQANKFL